MNLERRLSIERVIETLEAQIECIEILELEEQEYFDNMPESFQGGAKGDAVQSAIDHLSDAQFRLDGIVESLREAAA